MRFPLICNPQNSPSATAARFITFCGAMNWASAETTTRFKIPPGGGILKKARVRLPSAPGAGKTWRLQAQVNGAVVEGVTIEISGTSTTVAWTGELALKEKDTLVWKLTPVGEPTIASFGEGAVIEPWFATEGKTFWFPFGGSGNMTSAEASTTVYTPPLGMNNTGWTLNEGTYRIVVPGNFTLKALAALLSGVAGSGKSYTLAAWVNRAEAKLPVKIEGSSAVEGSATGAVALKAGDTLEIRCVPNNTPTARSCVGCLVLESEVEGEMFVGGSDNGTKGSSSKGQWLWPDGASLNWVAGGTGIRRPSSLIYQRFYAEADPPGAGQSCAFGLVEEGVSPVLKVKLEGAAQTTGSDTAHSMTTQGGKCKFEITEASAGAANTNAHWGYVVRVPQPSTGNFLEVF